MEFNRLCLFVFSLASAIAGVSAQGATGSGSMCANMETIEAACDACCGAGIYCKESPDDNEFVFCGNTIPACGNTIGKTQSQQECQCGSQTTCNAQDYCLENGYLNYPNELPDTCLTDCPIGSVLDETCKQCPTGYSYNSSLTCDACPEGRYSDKEGSVGECKLCPGGKYAKSTNSTACTDCGKGKQLSQGEDASSHGSESKCTDCVSGKYARNTGATNCVECASAKTTGATTCEGCPPGKSVKSESTGPNGATTYVCEDCTLGSYNSQQNAASCTTCPKGYFADTNNERDKCDACTRGHFGTVEEAKTKEEGCKKCLKGSFSNDEGMEHCPNCPKGRYGDETGLSKESLCKNCDAGKIGSSKTGANASTSCQDCSTGRYNKNVGEFLSSSCKSCPKGKYL
jgi:proprotein convertase subtilisin/kexin type 5